MRVLYLQSILEQLVHLGRDGQVNSAVGNLDNESALDLWVDLGDDLELLAIGNVVGLVDGGFEAAESSVVEGLFSCVSKGLLQQHWSIHSSRQRVWNHDTTSSRFTYRSAGNSQLDLPPLRAHEHAKLLHNTL
jgi:hypothetical protein